MNLVESGWDLRFCIYNKLPNEVSVASPRTKPRCTRTYPIRVAILWSCLWSSGLSYSISNLYTTHRYFSRFSESVPCDLSSLLITENQHIIRFIKWFTNTTEDLITLTCLFIFLFFIAIWLRCCPLLNPLKWILVYFNLEKHISCKTVLKPMSSEFRPISACVISNFPSAKMFSMWYSP